MPARVTQQAVEVLYGDPLPPGVQFTANPILARRLPDYSWTPGSVGINESPPPPLQTGPVSGVSVTPDPILAKRLPDYSFVGPYFMRDPNARITQLGLEVVQAGVSQARITQLGLEVVIKNMPQGRQRTELGQHPDPRRLFNYSWTPGSVGINLSPPPPLQTGPVAGVSVTPDPILAKRLPDYSFIGRNFMRDGRMRVTQAGVEVVFIANPNMRVTQAGVEVLFTRIPIGKQRMELGQHPDPRRQFDYSWAVGMPQAMFLTPPPPPPPGAQYTALGQHPDPRRLFNYSWVSFIPQTFLNQVAGATASASGGMSTATALVVSAFLAAQGTSLPAMAGSVFPSAIAILTATGQQAPNTAQLLSALSTLQATGSISAATVATATSVLNNTGFSPGVALLSALATITASDDVTAIVSFVATSGMFAAPQGLVFLNALTSLSASGAQLAPVGVSAWALPPTKPAAYFDYSYVAGRNLSLLAPVTGVGGQTFQVVMVL